MCAHFCDAAAHAPGASPNFQFSGDSPGGTVQTNQVRARAPSWRERPDGTHPEVACRESYVLLFGVVAGAVVLGKVTVKGYGLPLLGGRLMGVTSLRSLGGATRRRFTVDLSHPSSAPIATRPRNRRSQAAGPQVPISGQA
jgi:hypothetical protein